MSTDILHYTDHANTTTAVRQLAYKMFLIYYILWLIS